MIKRFFSKLDTFACKYLGFNECYCKPQLVEFISNNLYITNTESNKRHLQTMPFSEINLSEYSDEDKSKLGKAIGKSIATNLIIKFD